MFRFKNLKQKINYLWTQQRYLSNERLWTNVRAYIENCPYILFIKLDTRSLRHVYMKMSLSRKRKRKKLLFAFAQDLYTDNFWLCIFIFAFRCSSFAIPLHIKKLSQYILNIYFYAALRANPRGKALGAYLYINNVSCRTGESTCTILNICTKRSTLNRIQTQTHERHMSLWSINRDMLKASRNGT